ncbi:MAG: hypothetical protein HY332_04655 [Chloroflexi bacterium]|nr:hypothetical protein [Chloroflexota bacterium]
MNTNDIRNDARQRLFDAELKSLQAWQRYQALRRAALFDEGDLEEFDRAVVAYRQAERELEQARAACAADAACAAATATEAQATGLDGPYPEPPTRRLLFARWLVQTGRLSDWDVARGPAGPAA